MMQVLWALDFHRVHYKIINYTPLLGERWLRRKTGKKDGLITVPVMFTPEGSQSCCSDHLHLTSQEHMSFITSLSQLTFGLGTVWYTD